MIDYFAIGLTHALLALAAWRFLMRDDIDRDDGKPDRPFADRMTARRNGRRQDD